MLTVLLVTILQWSVSVNASLQCRCSSSDLDPSSQDQVEVPIHDGIGFQRDYNITGAVLVDLNSASKEVFDYCDPNNYSPEKIHPLLPIPPLSRHGSSVTFILMFNALKMDCDPQHYRPVDIFNINKVSPSRAFFFLLLF